MVLALSNLGEFLLPLIRGVALARILPPEQFGLAISISVVASVAELVTEIGITQMAVRSATEETVGTLHTLALLRGLSLGTVVALCGPLFAAIFQAPGTAWIYWLVGAASVLRGMSHLEVKMRMREYRYGAEAATLLGGHLVWTLVSVSAAIVLRDYRAMVVGLLAYSASCVLISHACSSSSYSLRWSKPVVRDAVRYGRPLVLNGVALAIGNLGDRFFIGARVGLAPLAHYTALATSAFTPRTAVARFLTSLFMPQFVNVKTDAARRQLGDIWIIVLCTVGAVFGLCYIAVGQAMTVLVFGPHYAVDQTIVDLIALLACIRYIASAPVAPSMAVGRTSLVLYGTASAASGLLIAACLLLRFPNLHVMVGAMVAGEGLALFWILDRLRRIFPFTPSILWTSVSASVGIVLVLNLALASGIGAETRYALCAAGLVFEAGLLMLMLRRSGSNFADVAHTFFPRHGHAAENA